MENRRIAGATLAVVAAAAMALLPGHIEHYPLIAQELVWEAFALVIAAGLALAVWPARRKRHAV